MPTLALIGGVLGLHLVYVGSWLDVEFHLRTSHERVLFQLVPAALLWCVALAREVLRGEGTAAVDLADAGTQDAKLTMRRG